MYQAGTTGCCRKLAVCIWRSLVSLSGRQRGDGAVAVGGTGCCRLCNKCFLRCSGCGVGAYPSEAVWLLLVQLELGLRLTRLDQSLFRLHFSLGHMPGQLSFRHI